VKEAGIARAIPGTAKKLPAVTNAAMARAMHFKALRLLSGVIFWGSFRLLFRYILCEKTAFYACLFYKTKRQTMCIFHKNKKYLYTYLTKGTKCGSMKTQKGEAILS
jgi:hypothetical protein